MKTALHSPMHLHTGPQGGNLADLWQAVVTRDRSADGRFVYGVSSTRIYCRPACPSRRPRAEGVEYFATPALAEAAGFRACFRCKPQNSASPSQAWLAAVRLHLQKNADRAVTLQELSRFAGVSVGHLQRAFVQEFGLSPRSFHTALRAQALGKALPSGQSVTEAIYSSGHNSAAAGYATARSLAMAPRKLRKSASGEMVVFTVANTCLGKLLVAATAKGLCRVAFAETSGSLSAEIQSFRHAFGAAQVLDARGRTAMPASHENALAMLQAAVPALQLMASGEQARLLPVDLRGTAFQQKVWQALRKLPRGTTVSYSQLAAQLGQPTAARAVARACATNTLALAVPCHRVNASNGTLAGYRWGVKRKRALQSAESKPDSTSRSIKSNGHTA